MVGGGWVVGGDFVVDLSLLGCRGRLVVGRDGLFVLGPELVLPGWLWRSSGVWLLAYGQSEALAQLPLPIHE